MNSACHLFLEVADGVLISISEEVEDFMLDVILLQVVHQMGSITLQPHSHRQRLHTDQLERLKFGWGWEAGAALTLTCSLEVTAQNTISVKPCDGNMRKQIPPITRPSLISDSVLCFLSMTRCMSVTSSTPPPPPTHCDKRWLNYGSTHGSNTSRVMYSLGMRGSWWENTFWRPTSHIRIRLLGFWFKEFPMTWNSITPLRSSRRAASSRAEWADSRLVWNHTSWL